VSIVYTTTHTYTHTQVGLLRASMRRAGACSGLVRGRSLARGRGLVRGSFSSYLLRTSIRRSGASGSSACSCEREFDMQRFT
jgi:hypothetical protein